jgi:hypothetical protein
LSDQPASNWKIWGATIVTSCALAARECGAGLGTARRMAPEASHAAGVVDDLALRAGRMASAESETARIAQASEDLAVTKHADEAAEAAARSGRAREAAENIVQTVACDMFDRNVEPTIAGVRASLTANFPSIALHMAEAELAQFVQLVQVLIKNWRGDRVKYDSVCGLR